ncbi:MAG: amidohydrolase [Oscillospiraceae bacterium]|jgi:aminobenzoyl-glutamate utilization protein B|nr:amidohydrolase [Oscillospiraceae bacterium]
MDKNKQAAVDAIDAKAPLIAEVSDAIWEYAELSLMEFKSADKFCEVLTQEGFTVERGICNIPTAFAASFGSGRPHIGILAEYDALSGLSQRAGKTEHDELVPNGCGHGCGHSMLGAGSLAAIIGLKAYLEQTHTPGTVTLYGCPGEEGGAAKAFMARNGLWKTLDAAITWHPSDANEIETGSSNSCIQTQYTFHGIASHAAGDPEKGRSALDGVELMNVGVQFLREHMSSKARIHYAITDGGGRSPNVVQPKASVLYMVRSNRVAEAVELQKRVDDIAQGAALMTGTTFEKKFIDGLADTVPNHTLETILYENFQALGVPSYTDEEYAFMDALSKTYPGGDTALPGTGAKNDPAIAEQVKALRAQSGHGINDFLLPLYQGEAFEPGSTDVGDVSWLTPTAQVHVAVFANGAPGHSWQNVSVGATTVAHKAVLHAGKVMALGAIDLLEKPDLLAKARQEFEKATAEGYTCPTPADAVPVVPD